MGTMPICGWFVDQRHVGENVRVAHVIQGLTAFGRDYETARVPEIDGPPIYHVRGRMQGLHEGEVEVALRDHTAGVSRIGLLHPMARQVARKLMHRNERAAGFLADPDRVADVILMAVSQGHMSHSLRHIAEGDIGLLKGGIARQKRIDQDAAFAGLHAKAGMAEPRNFHHLTFRLAL
jgi:hypothetical protein